MSRKDEEFYRFFSVTDVRTHEKGHTEYKVLGRFVSKPCPEDVTEVVVWTRYSELKKLHTELANTHMNMFRIDEEFPPFPPAQIFGRGRFDEDVIEERRKATEDMLVFSTTIPALYNSPQLIDFFRDGEVSRPQEPTPDYANLPPPLIPSDCEAAQGCASPPKEDVRPVLSDNDLAVFDPCYKRDRCKSHDDHSELFSLPLNNPADAAAYLNRASGELASAMASEAEGDVSAALCGYRTVVDVLISGVKDDGDPARKDAVIRRIAQYLGHAEKLLEGHGSPTRAQDL